jgi:hypothetical protein
VAPRLAGSLRQGKHFFFEKKKQKTFGSSVFTTVSTRRLYNSKSFLVLFFKKELLPSRERGAH